MRPDERCIRNRDMFRYFTCIDITYIDAQLNDAVATIRRTNQGVLVDTRLMDEALLMSTSQTELDRVAETDVGIFVDDRLLLEYYVQVVNTIVFNTCL